MDIDPFGEHESRPDEPTDENIPLTPVGGSTWGPEREQETSFRGESQRTRLVKEDVKRLYKKLKVRQESIDLLKGRLTNQITSFKETIAKVLNKDISLATKIRKLFREQGITIASVLMVIGVLVEALLPGGGGGGGGGTAASPPPLKDEKGVKEWLRNKLKALASLLGRLGVKAAEVLPGIIGAIISWILNRAAEVVGWVSQNLWALVVGVGGLSTLYVYGYEKVRIML